MWLIKLYSSYPFPEFSWKFIQNYEGGHSIECITNAGHSIAFNVFFLHFLTFIFDLLTYY